VTFSLNAWQLLVLVLVSAFLWMFYVQSKDRHQPEPIRRLALAVLLGVVACGITYFTYALIERLKGPDLKYGDVHSMLLYFFGIVGPVEEGSKVLVACLFVFRWRDYDEPIDGFVYASAISFGYAGAESCITLGGESWVYQLAHTVALPITHALFSAIWGLSFSHSHFRVGPGWRRRCWQAGGVATAMMVHGLYDFLVIAFRATLVASGLALVIWVAVIWRLGLLRKQAVAAARLGVKETTDAMRAPK
jgi:RsiW-degrading membrane proteinase PrsW (M82 family)